MSEQELCLLLEEYYRDYEVYKEVPCSGRLDIYAKKGGLWVAVEVKKQLSTLLITQALRHMNHAHFSYIAIPDLKDKSPGVEICKRLGIGVMVYVNKSKYSEGWQIANQPNFNRRIKPYNVLESMKKAVAGVQHNTQSEFKTTIFMICNRLKRNGGQMSLKELFAESKYHYSNERSAIQAIKKYFEKGAIKEFSISNGIMQITDYGLDLVA